ncbi:MFS transporter [Francisellaceae bacterium CB300]
MIKLKNIPRSIYVVLLGTLFVRLVYFMLWPFMAIIFYNKFNLSIVITGAVLGLATFVSIVFSVYCGNLSDRIGRKVVLIVGLYILMLSTIPVIFYQSLFSYLTLLFSVSIGRGLTETIFKTIISDEIQEQKFKEKVFYWQYFFINIGGAIGPLLGVILTLNYPKLTFLILFFVYLTYIIVCSMVFKNNMNQPQTKKYSFIKSLNIIRKDRAFALLIITYTIVLIVFGQLDSTLAQYFSREGNNSLILLFSYLIVINCGVIIIFQFPFLRIIKSLDENLQVYLGIFLFGLSQLIFSFTPTLSYVGWIIGVIILSFGEIILFSVINVQVDKMSPEGSKGLYFGASTFYMLGLVLAPLLGGILLRFFGRSTLFLIMAFLCLIMLWVYRKAWLNIVIRK